MLKSDTNGSPVLAGEHGTSITMGLIALDDSGAEDHVFATGALHEGVWLRIKRIADRALACLALLLLWPALIIIGAMVRVDSAGPALFRQVRIGYQGRTFTVIKFRTMHAALGDEACRTRAVTRADDPRITRLGAVLRRSRIDELPQILNVIRGEMSFIGPRPDEVAPCAHFESHIPCYRHRQTVYPGISGWAQVNQGHVTEVEDVRQKLQYDLYYIRHFSVWLDLLIVGKTIRTMLTGFGSK